MFNAALKVKLKNFELLEILKKDIQKNLVEKGLDLPITKALPQLKTELKFFTNNQATVITPDSSKTPEQNALSFSTMPKSDADIIKYITGLDVDKLRKTGDYTTAIDSKVVIVNDNRVRFRLPISDYETFDETLHRATSFFNQAIFIMVDGSGNIKYFMNPGIDLSKFVKIVCSTDVGDTTKSRNKFTNYRDGNRMSRQGDSDIGRFAEWSLKQNFVKTITNPSSGLIDLTKVVQEIKEGNYDDAIRIAGSMKVGNNQFDLIQKINNIKDRKELTPEMAAHSNIISLINNLKIFKDIKNNEVSYELISSYTEDASGTKFFDLIYNDINVWIIQNSVSWFKQFVKVAEDILSKYK